MRWVLVAFLLAGGGVEDAWTPPAPDAPSGPTWYADVGPILRAKCTTCHQPGAIAPFSLLELDDARAERGRLLDEIDAGTMPPFYAEAEPDCTPSRPWRDDPRIT